VAVTFQEWTTAVFEALADAAFRPGMGVVHDLRRMVRIPSATEASDRVDFLVVRSRTLKVSRWAIVVSGQAHYSMARLAEFHADKMSTGGRPSQRPVLKVWAGGQGVGSVWVRRIP